MASCLQVLFSARNLSTCCVLIELLCFSVLAIASHKSRFASPPESLLANPALFAGRGANPYVPPLQMAQEYLDLAAKYAAPDFITRAHLFKILHT